MIYVIYNNTEEIINMEKKNFKGFELEVIELETKDVLVTSGCGEDEVFSCDKDCIDGVPCVYIK
jgi:hypothetical protein